MCIPHFKALMDSVVQPYLRVYFDIIWRYAHLQQVHMW